MEETLESGKNDVPRAVFRFDLFQVHTQRLCVPQTEAGDGQQEFERSHDFRGLLKINLPAASRQTTSYEDTRVKCCLADCNDAGDPRGAPIVAGRYVRPRCADALELDRVFAKSNDTTNCCGRSHKAVMLTLQT